MLSSTMAAQQNTPGQVGPVPLRAISTPATDSDLNELLAALASQVKALRRENKQLASVNSRLIVVLAEHGVVIPPEPAPGQGLLTPPAATAEELTDELRGRLDRLQKEGTALREENARLVNLARDLELPAWRIEETRVGTSRLVPGPRAFIRRRRVEPTTLPPHATES